MAVLNGIISKLNGSAGNLTFKQLGGKTVISEKISSITNTKTDPSTHFYQQPTFQNHLKIPIG